MTAKYAWIITRDSISGKAGGRSATGVLGPRNAPIDLVEALKAGNGRSFRMLDDDREVYYHGRIIVHDTAGLDCVGSELDFRPLDDFGTPDSGCTMIEYRSASGSLEVL